MLNVLSHLFAAVCGQDPGHTWAPGGILLPCCERCMGLYAGAGVAALLHLWLRPRLSGRFLEIHGAFLLFMAPFGFHWLAHGPVLRTATGVLFGFGVVTFLWLPLNSRITHHVSRITYHASRFPYHVSRITSYFLILAATLMLLPLAASRGGTFVAYLLSGLIVWGALVLIMLVSADVALGLIGALRWLRRRASPSVPA